MPHDPELRAQLRAAQEEVAQLRYNADLHLDWYHSVQADLRASEAANAALRGALESISETLTSYDLSGNDIDGVGTGETIARIDSLARAALARVQEASIGIGTEG